VSGVGTGLPISAAERRSHETQRVTWRGTLADAFLTVIKVAFGIIGQSQTLVADGLHSLADVAADLIVLFATRHLREVVLHYLDGRVHLDVILPLALLGDTADAQREAHQIGVALRQAVASDPDLGRIRVCFE
jgi:predicted Co/Zn/Cd cation transporter (cation efflux family)